MQTLQKTYKRNFPTHNLIIDDIRNIDNNVIPKLVRGRDVDVIIGGPPCQGFSLAGNIGRSFIDDERNRLFKEFVLFCRMCSTQNVCNGKCSSDGNSFKRKNYKNDSRSV